MSDTKRLEQIRIWFSHDLEDRGTLEGLQNVIKTDNDWGMEAANSALKALARVRELEGEVERIQERYTQTLNGWGVALDQRDALREALERFVNGGHVCTVNPKHCKYRYLHEVNAAPADADGAMDTASGDPASTESAHPVMPDREPDCSCGDDPHQPWCPKVTIPRLEKLVKKYAPKPSQIPEDAAAGMALQKGREPPPAESCQWSVDSCGRPMCQRHGSPGTCDNDYEETK